MPVLSGRLTAPRLRVPSAYTSRLWCGPRASSLSSQALNLCSLGGVGWG